jgi:hypothetical protein
MRTTVTIPDPLLRTARRRAAEQGITLSAFLEDALRIRLAHKEPSSAPLFHLHTVSGKMVNPNMDLDRTSALEMLEEEARLADKRVR